MIELSKTERIYVEDAMDDYDELDKDERRLQHFELARACAAMHEHKNALQQMISEIDYRLMRYHE